MAQFTSAVLEPPNLDDLEDLLSQVRDSRKSNSPYSLGKTSQHNMSIRNLRVELPAGECCAARPTLVNRQ